MNAQFAVGDAVWDFALADSDGATRRLSEMTASGRVLLAFYRGHW